MEAIDVAKDVIGIVLVLAAITLCVTITIVVAKLFPAVRQTVLNVEKATRGAEKATQHLAEAALNVKHITANFSAASKDISRLAPHAVEAMANVKGITANLLTASKDISQSAPHAAEAMANVKDITANLLAASKDISQATPVLRLLGPAGATVNIAQHGLGRIGGWLRNLIRR